MPNGIRVAYLLVGDGPPIIFPAWWFTHLEVLWAWPAARTFFEALAQHFTVVYYDKPSRGLSDHDQPAYGLDAQVDALSVLIEHLGFRRVALFGFSQGGPAVIRYAAERTERVAQLILFSTAARVIPPNNPEQAAAV
jgi:pimeloyl-ACP methyl ester carboxylesterase